jgi:hypothetical protein
MYAAAPRLRVSGSACIVDPSFRLHHFLRFNPHVDRLLHSARLMMASRCIVALDA